ncbi:uncharacterized protein LOC114761993 [Neltuma alba]|uniref:uncharacterized protein LOC114761993 n=1 Tax=Neltuma alba TaxID=207710 RepID=UPI0010A41E49|nr:uncharacterized protein LOC114761993 [Prosopis alba]
MDMIASSGRVSERLIKVVAATKDSFVEYDWATFVVQELSKEMEDYLRVVRKQDGSCNVGGCIYLLLLYLLEYFPITESAKHDHTEAISFWTDKRVNEMSNKERKSRIGLLYSEGRAGVPDNKGGSESVPYLDPELKDLRERLVGMIRENSNKLVAIVDNELMKVQLEREYRPKSNNKRHVRPYEEEQLEGEADGEDDGEKDKDGDAEDDGEKDRDGDGENEDSEHDIEEEEGEEEDIEQVSLQLSPITIIHPDAEGGASDEEEVLDKAEQVRRSKRPMKPAPKLQSPWVVPKVVKRTNRKMDDKEKFFITVSKMCSSADGDKRLVELYDFHVTRDDLRSLGGMHRVSNHVMSMVCHMLMGEIKEGGGQVRRHIFDAYFMSKLCSPGWSVAVSKKELQEEHVGYNIGDCDLILGPALVDQHWFCFVLEPKVMNFYVLDSLNVYVSGQPKKKNKQKGTIVDDMEKFHNICRDRFHDIIELVQPKLIGKKPKPDIIYPDVAKQNNIKDCGVYVMLWLKSWHPQAALNYTPDQVAQFRRDLMWWMVNHPNNACRDAALTLLEEQEDTRKSKRQRSTQ